MAEALSIIKERDGWKGLRRGMGPRIMTVAPSTAISWLSYEFFSASLFSFLSPSPFSTTTPDILATQHLRRVASAS